MKRTLPFGIHPTTLGRLVAGLLLAFSLVAAAGAAHSKHAAADTGDLTAPTLLSARLDGTTAYVVFRDNADGETQYYVVARSADAPAPFDLILTARPGVPGVGRTPTVSIDGLAEGFRYCFYAIAYGDSPQDSSYASNVICADPPAPSAPQPPGPCGINNVNVTVQGTFHNYSYNYFCNGQFTFQVTGLYDPTTKRAEEVLQDGATQIGAAWTCPSDPWGSGGALMVCTLPVPASVQNPLPSFPITSGALPFSVRDLPDGSLQTLATALQAAVNPHPASPAGEAGGPHIDTSADPIKLSPTCLACSGQGPAPTTLPVLPDFAITRISADQPAAQGFTGAYEVVLANLGARPQTQVQVEIQVTGALQLSGAVQAPDGFTCTGNAPIICVGPLGGAGDAPATTVAVFQLQAYAAGPGTGYVSSIADPNNLITESDESNNAKTLAVTIK